MYDKDSLRGSEIMNGCSSSYLLHSVLHLLWIYSFLSMSNKRRKEGEREGGRERKGEPEREAFKTG